MAGKNPQRPLFDRHGDPICAPLESGRAAGYPATDKRQQETVNSIGRSCAVSPLMDDLFHWQGDVTSTTKPSTRATTPGCRISTMATRITTTRTTKLARELSADSTAEPAPFYFDALVQAYLDCRRHKRNTHSAMAFELNQEANLTELYQQLISGQYEPGTSICFAIAHPKPREVWAAQFRDRIVHHLLVNHIGQRFEKTFIADSSACIKGRGTLYAVNRLEAKIRSVTQNWRQPAYYLKCDVANFFVSIKKDVIASALSSKIHEPWWRALALQILWHDPRTNYKLQGNPALLQAVPKHKQLTRQTPDRGLPIGNLSSQFFANIYMNEIDQHVKHHIKAKHYCRYVDDMILLHPSAQWLNAALADIKHHLGQKLGIVLNPKKTIIQPIHRGVDFVGQAIKPWHRVTRKRTVNHAINRIYTLPKQKIAPAANSYYGLFRQATHSHQHRCALSKALLQRGNAVNHKLTKTYKHQVTA